MALIKSIHSWLYMRKKQNEKEQVMAIIYLLLGIIIGASIMLLWMKNRSTQEQKNVSEQLAVLRSQLETERKNVDERIAVVKENALQQLETERKAWAKQLRNELQEAG